MSVDQMGLGLSVCVPLYRPRTKKKYSFLWFCMYA
jgi:hypothetical protein